MNKEEEVREIEVFLLSFIRPLLKNTQGKRPDLSKVVVWLKEFNVDSGVVIIGLALSGDVGCSPFCGCAANQIAEFIEEKMKSKFFWLKRVRGEAAMPSEKELKQWNDS